MTLQPVEALLFFHLLPLCTSPPPRFAIALLCFALLWFCFPFLITFARRRLRRCPPGAIAFFCRSPLLQMWVFMRWLQVCGASPSLSVPAPCSARMQQSFIWVYYVCFRQRLKHTISSSDFRLHWWVLLNSKGEQWASVCECFGGVYMCVLVGGTAPNWIVN